MENLIPIHELEKRMRPGAYSAVGFLGVKESLEEVLRQDELTLQNLGLNCERLATELEKIVSNALRQKQERVYKNHQEFMERECPPISWGQDSSAPIFTINNLPSTEIGFLVDSKYQLIFVQFRGLQECPWDCDKEHWGSFDFLLLNRQTGEYIIAPGLIAHLIREHHFFEGLESPYRVEPCKLAQVLDLLHEQRPPTNHTAQL
jgi:hypothetical protein